MSILIPVLVLGLVGIALVGQQKKAKGSGKGGPAFSREEESGPWPFYATRPLSQIEQVLYFRMVNALPGLVVLPQVGLSRFLGVRRGADHGRWHNRINRMSVDFMVCTRDLSIVAAVELDDASHQRPDRQAADAKKDKALAAAGLRLVRWQARDLPSEATIRATLVDPRHRPTATLAEEPEQAREQAFRAAA